MTTPKTSARRAAGDAHAHSPEDRRTLRVIAALELVAWIVVALAVADAVLAALQ